MKSWGAGSALEQKAQLKSVKTTIEVLSTDEAQLTPLHAADARNNASGRS
jgi:hypothetical protein